MGFKPQPILPHPGFVAGRYYSLQPGSGSGTLTLTENTLYLHPFFTPVRAAFDRFSFNITTGAGAAENEVRTGIFQTTSGVTGALVLDNGRTVVGTGTGNINVTIAQTLAPGWYLLGIISNRAAGAGATQPTLRAAASEQRAALNYYEGLATPDYSAGGQFMSNAQTVADWTTYVLPSTVPAVTYTAGVVPMLYLRAA